MDRVEYKRNPAVLIMLLAVGVIQGWAAIQSLIYGRLTFALLQSLVAALALATAAWLWAVPLLRIEGEEVTVYKNAFRPRLLERDQICAVETDGRRAFLVLVDGSRVEVPLGMARARDRDQMTASLSGLTAQNQGHLDTRPPESSPVDELSAPSSLLTRNLTLAQVLLWGSLFAVITAAVLVVFAQYNQYTMQTIPRVPTEPDSASYSVVTARELGLQGDAAQVEGQVVAADFPRRDTPVVWIAGKRLGADPDSGLPYAIPIRFLDDAEVTVDGTQGSIKACISDANLRHHEPRSIHVVARVKVLGNSAFVSWCSLETSTATGP